MWAVAPQLVRAAPHLLRAGAAIVGLAAAGTAIEGIDLIGRGGIAGHRWQTYQWEPEQPPPSPPPKRPKPEGSLVKEFISAAGWILYFDKVFSSERPPKNPLIPKSTPYYHLTPPSLHILQCSTMYLKEVTQILRIGLQIAAHKSQFKI